MPELVRVGLWDAAEVEILRARVESESLSYKKKDGRKRKRRHWSFIHFLHSDFQSVAFGPPRFRLDSNIFFS